MHIIDPDLGRALSGGYHRQPARTTPWPDTVRDAAIRALTLAHRPLTTTELGERLGLDSRGRSHHLRPALVVLVRRGVVECIPHPDGPNRPCTWQLTRAETDTTKECT